MSMKDEEEQEWYEKRHPQRRPAQDADEVAFLREHPGWLAAAWAHPEWDAWQRKRGPKASK